MRCGDILCEAGLGRGPAFLKLPGALSNALGLAVEITAKRSDKGSFCKEGLGLWLFDVNFFFFFLPFSFFFLFGFSSPIPLATEKRLAKAS